MTRVATAANAEPATRGKTNGNGHAVLSTLERAPYYWERLPKTLRQRVRCSLYRESSGRKIPYSPANPTQKASISDPKTWTDFETALRAYEAFPSFDGINAVCSPEFTFVDIDDCLDDNLKPSPQAQEIMRELPETYWEVSPSGLSQ